MLNIEEAKAFMLSIEGYNSTQLDELYETLNDEMESITVELDNKTAKKIIKLISLSKDNDFSVTNTLISLVDLLQADKKPALDYTQLRLLQDVLVRTTWNGTPDEKDPVAHGRILLEVLRYDKLVIANTELSKYEQKIKAVMDAIMKAKQEEKTGLEHKSLKDDDGFNSAK